jgi:hypothetical protein
VLIKDNEKRPALCNRIVHVFFYTCLIAEQFICKTH